MTESNHEGVQLFNAINTNGYTDSFSLVALRDQASFPLKIQSLGWKIQLYIHTPAQNKAHEEETEGISVNKCMAMRAI